MSKYKAIKTVVDGIEFDSRKEARRYQELKLLERAGVIKDLALQPNFLVQESFEKNGKKYKPINYIADFCYWDCEKKQYVVEDVKGFKTDGYRQNEEIKKRKRAYSDAAYVLDKQCLKDFKRTKRW